MELIKKPVNNFQFDVPARFIKKIAPGPEGCWIWTGSIQRRYTRMMIDGENCLMHRYMYELLVGSIPDGMELDHLCLVKRCVYPAHVEPVTHAENMRRHKELDLRGIHDPRCEWADTDIKFYDDRFDNQRCYACAERRKRFGQ